MKFYIITFIGILLNVFVQNSSQLSLYGCNDLDENNNARNEAANHNIVGMDKSCEEDVSSFENQKENEDHNCARAGNFEITPSDEKTKCKHNMEDEKYNCERDIKRTSSEEKKKHKHDKKNREKKKGKGKKLNQANNENDEDRNCKKNVESNNSKGSSSEEKKTSKHNKKSNKYNCEVDIKRSSSEETKKSKHYKKNSDEKRSKGKKHQHGDKTRKSEQKEKGLKYEKYINLENLPLPGC